MDTPEVDRATVWRLLFITMTNLFNSVESELKRAEDLTLIDIGCLFALNSAGATGSPMGSLAALFGVDPSVITYRIRRLEGRGLVSRQTSGANRRFVNALITDEGRRVLARARARLLRSADTHFFDELDPTATSALPAVLEPLLAAQQRRRIARAEPTLSSEFGQDA